MPTITGDNSDNALTGTAGDDTISGLGGNDSLSGLDGNDQLDGGTGNDLLDGGTSSGSSITLTPTAQADLLHGNTLVNGLGGVAGFGENVLIPTSDGSTGAIDITSIFGLSGIDFFGTHYASLYINNDGNITFNSPLNIHVPVPFDGSLAYPIIAPFWAAVETRPDSANPGGHISPGGTSTGSDRVWYDLDPTNGVMTVTWDDVVFQFFHAVVTNAFQLQLINEGDGKFDIVFRYETIAWTTGDPSATEPRGGYSAGDGTNFYDLPQSGNGSALTALPTTAGNTGIAGVDVFQIGGGSVLAGDTLNGGGGLDQAIYPSARAAYAITRNSNGSITVAGPDGTDTLTNIERLAFSDQMIVVRASPVSDFSGEGMGDLLWQNDSGQAAVWEMNGLSLSAGGFVGGVPSAGWQEIASGDFDGDGHADILWQNSSSLQTAVWMVNGFGVTGAAVVGGTPSAGWKVIGSGDFDGDGKSDILWQNTTTNQAAIWEMNGLNLAAGAIAGSTPSAGWKVIGSGDFDGDGKSDILWQNTTTLQAAIWLMNGFNLVSGAVVGGTPSAGWTVKGSGDFDGDGKSDILWQNSTTLQAAVWEMNGLTLTAGNVVGGTPSTGWVVKGAADYDGDGKSDILWQNTSGQAAVWLMNGFTLASGSTVGNNPGTTWHLIGLTG